MTASIEANLLAIIEQRNAEAKRHQHRVPIDPLVALDQWTVTDEQVQTMKATTMIWRDTIAMSHMAGWMAKGNGGKTSLALYAAGELAETFKVFFFQEDASAGDLPALHQHAKDHGYRMLNSTLAGSTPDEQIKVLGNLARNDTDLSNFVMFFDTLKKYTDLMSKGGARAFFKLMRALTQRGATIIMLGHTNKHHGADGKAIFEGVGDVRNDADEMIYIDATEKDANGIVTLTTRPDKMRCMVLPKTFELDTKTREVRALDHVVDVATILEKQRRAKEDEPLISAIQRVLQDGGKNLTELVEQVAKQSEASKPRVRDLVERYGSEDVNDPDALWCETRIRIGNARYISLKPAA